MISYTGQIFDTPSAYQHDGMFLKIVTNAGYVGGYLNTGG
jgi:hypothetical protein